MNATPAGVSFGIDIGGSGMKAGPVDLATGMLTADRHKISTPKPATPAAMAAVVGQLVDHFDWSGTVGVAFPAIVRNGVAASAANIDKSWIGTDIDAVFTEASGRDVHVINDADAAGLAEMRWGAGRGFDDFAYVTVGTGVGVGLVVNGKPTRGFAHSELGHVRPVRLAGDDWPGACSFHGDCVEGLASGPAIKARLGSRDIGSIAADDPVWETVAHALAQLCHAIVCAACPMRIAIGGGVVERQPHVLPRIQEKLVESLAGYIDLPPGLYLVTPGLGNQAGPRGSSALAMSAAEAR